MVASSPGSRYTPVLRCAVYSAVLPPAVCVTFASFPSSRYATWVFWLGAERHALHGATPVTATSALVPSSDGPMIVRTRPSGVWLAVLLSMSMTLIIGSPYCASAFGR